VILFPLLRPESTAADEAEEADQPKP
jgi:hypothetical protein